MAAVWEVVGPQSTALGSTSQMGPFCPAWGRGQPGFVPGSGFEVCVWEGEVRQTNSEHKALGKYKAFFAVKIEKHFTCSRSYEIPA